MGSSWISYRYDGSFEGFLCCVFDSFYRREDPAAILDAQEKQALLFPEHLVKTDPAHAQRVFASLRQRISPQAADLVTLGFLTCAPDRELLLLQFIRLGFRCGRPVTDMLGDGTVCRLTRAVSQACHEAHLFTGFVRFSEYDGKLAAVITPKNRVLPLVSAHFCGRYPEESFLIYDRTHQEALLYHPHEAAILPLAHFSLPAPGAAEARFRGLWQRFYTAVAIEGRLNPKCRQAHMPKRYWEDLTEFQESGAAKSAPFLDLPRG